VFLLRNKDCNHGHETETAIDAMEGMWITSVPPVGVELKYYDEIVELSWMGML